MSKLVDNYDTLHLHTELSLLDSATKYQDYIDKAVSLGQKAIAFTEHGNIYQWVAKKLACDEAGLKYIHGVEVYLTEKLLWEDPRTGETSKVRDNFHTILLAKNMDGLREINELVSRSSLEDHFYYKPRISFDEFLKISGNVIKMSACLASPLNRLPVTHPMYERLVKHYDYLEIQPHPHPDQVAYNRHLAELSQRYRIPLVATTDTHSLNEYKAECRTMLQYSKHIEFADEDAFDLTYKSFDELTAMFRAQDAIPETLWMGAIENTRVISDSVEPFDPDVGFKYPVLYGEKDRDVLSERIEQGLQSKLASGAIPAEQEPAFRAAVEEEMRVFDKIEMSGFMLFMSELTTWCKENGIPVGFGRGSCGGSRVAYLIDIIDINPETWHTIFSRFANEDRKEIGDIDTDYAPDDREKVYAHLIGRFGQEKTAFILAIGTIKAKGCIDEICRGLGVKWDKEHQHSTKRLKELLTALKKTDTALDFGTHESDEFGFYDAAAKKITLPLSYYGCARDEICRSLTKEYDRIRKENEAISANNPWTGKLAAQIKDELSPIDDAARKIGNPGTEKYRKALLESEAYKAVAKKYPDVFRYFDGLLDAAISQSVHPAGIVASPITLRDNYGTFLSEGKEILQIDMDCVHKAGLVKYDILGLKNIGIIRDAYALLGKPYPKSHEIDWNDADVWADMLRSQHGIFQMESDFAFSLLRRFKPQNLFDMALLNAGTRPAGESYRDDLFQRKPHQNPSPILDELLKDNFGYLVYQEDTIRFLQELCGFSGSEADNVRRAIGHKDQERLDKALPEILEGYCKKSDQPRETAEAEAKEFLQIISDSSNYQFNYSHAIGYSMIGYLCAYLRYYHPAEFITAFLNNADNDADVKNGTELATLYNIRIVPPRFGTAKDRYMFDPDARTISKGIASVKYMNGDVANELYELAKKGKPETFVDLLMRMNEETRLDTRQRDILIKIDYFSEYGNARELLRIVDMFTFFKSGAMKKIAKEKLTPELTEIVAQYATDVGKSGAVAKSYTITDMPGLLRHCEQTIRDLHIPDFDLKNRIQNQLESLGYIDLTTNRKEDRRKLLITEVYPLKTKATKEIWGYALQVRSIGTGKTSRLTVRKRLYEKRPINRFDVIYASDVQQEKSGYWYLIGYQKVLA